jgi:hypothetical protein
MQQRTFIFCIVQCNKIIIIITDHYMGVLVWIFIKKITSFLQNEKAYNLLGVFQHVHAEITL